MKVWLALCGGLLWSTLALTLPARSSFVHQSAISAVVLAPDGARVAWLADEGARRAVWVQTLDGSAPRRAMAHTPASELSYTRDGRWLLLSSPTQVFALATQAQGGSGILTRLTQHSEWRVDTSEAAAIVVSAPAPGSAPHWQLHRIKIGQAPERLYQGARRIVAYAMDHDGQPRWLQYVQSSARVIYDQLAGRELMRCPLLSRCTPLAERDGALLLLSNQLDGDPLGLARLERMHADGTRSPLARDPRGVADLDFIVADPTGRIRFAGYRSSAAQWVALDARDRAAVKDLNRRFPGSLLRPQLSSTRWLVEERHASRAFARWHLYEPSTGRIQELLREGSGADPRRLEKRPYTWLASDGMALHGFLTLPPDATNTAPLVVLAHGGPWSHWQPTYNALAQFIASRGAIVFEPNHRGSTGHGLAYMTAANGEFGNGRVQRDIDDGVRALLASGVGDAKRVAIVGASFGGYAALLGATFTPELYQFAVAFVPPPDMAWTLTWVLRGAESLKLDNAVPMAQWLRALQLDVDNTAQMTQLRAQSPLANIHRLSRPVLIVAGGRDERVGIAGVIEYAARAKLANKAVTVLIDHNAGHRQRHDIARESNLYLVESMLHRHFAMAKPEPPSAAVQDYLRSLRSSPVQHGFLDGATKE